MEESVLETLVSRGWHFKDRSLVSSLIPAAAPSAAAAAAAAESELLSMDMRSFGAKSLPDASTIKKSSHLQGPIILQLVSVRDVYRSSIDAGFRDSEKRNRLLRFVLTDGHAEVTAVEYGFIPSASEDMVPGTKIRLDNKVMIHSGILCLNPKVVTIMGGIVQSLHEEWQMSQKYSGFSRSSLRLSQNDDDVGPPPFEKLQIEAHRPVSSKVSSHSSGKMIVNQMGRNERHQEGPAGIHSEADKATDESKMALSTRKGEDKPSSSEVRPKEVSEAVPVQNQAAAQKLLQKMSQPAYEDRYSRGQRRGKQEETPVFTLEEWERRKGNNLKPVGRVQDISRDEELARQLQNQLDLEDFQGSTNLTEAERIRMSMFSYNGADGRSDDGGREFRGRNRFG